MISSRRDPYLWIHLAGLATVPLWLDLCLAGLAVGDPIVPPWVELTTLGWVGTVPILWMQLTRPFYIFSLPGLALRPDKLAVERRQMLTLQRSWWSRLLVVLGAIALFLILYGLYQLAPIAAAMTPFAGRSRAVGWLICAIAFLLANLFVQVPATVLPLLLTASKTLAQTEPYEATAIRQRFSVVGLRVASILPDWADRAVPLPTADSPTAPAAETAAAPEPEPAAATPASVPLSQATHPPTDTEPLAQELSTAVVIEESETAAPEPAEAIALSHHADQSPSQHPTSEEPTTPGHHGASSPQESDAVVDTVASLTDIVIESEPTPPITAIAPGAEHPEVAAAIAQADSSREPS